MALFNPTKTGVLVTVRVTPRAGRTAIAGVLSQVFELPRRDIAIVAGGRSRTKRVELVGASSRAMDARLAAVL